jgi:hypothetical protein
MVAALARAVDPVSPGRWDGVMDASTATLPPPPACPTPLVDRRSIFIDWQVEAQRFKWILSERAGRDVGDEAIYQWVRDHWWGYLRARWLEHLHGKCFWIELDHGDFGLIQRAFQNRKDLLEQILDRLKDGQENLEIIRWAVHSDRDLVDPVIEILTELDINSRRLIHRFDQDGAKPPPQR